MRDCIRSRVISLRVKRRSGSRVALDLASISVVQDAFVIAVDQQSRERLERLSALKRIKPVDIQGLSKQLNQQQNPATEAELNGFIENSPIYVTELGGSHHTASTTPPPTAGAAPGPTRPSRPPLSNGHSEEGPEELELKQVSCKFLLFYTRSLITYESWQ
ncbi:uncharacterized protein LOC120353653 [Nilaparvata lugens]|uniref:uncharacterized protein LOC120353653 n=1 Tax=Nilaparvata lugens TaxID=108931 RepID=UPI00193D3DAA|nr:uncharacterized protein LOC120353653 [Nilaparvata lugens]